MSAAKSFWIDRKSEPLCLLEAFAQEVASYHLSDYVGAEFWVQIRNNEVNDRGLELHFDKDEKLCALKDIWKHPAIATATYLDVTSLGLTNGGAPLLVFDTSSTDNASSNAGGPKSSWLVFPKENRHVAFGGDLLHGIPDELEAVLASDPLAHPNKPTPPRSIDGVRPTAHYTRVSILVNVWTDVKPLGLKRIDWTGIKSPTHPGPHHMSLLGTPSASTSSSTPVLASVATGRGYLADPPTCSLRFLELAPHDLRRGLACMVRTEMLSTTTHVSASTNQVSPSTEGPLHYLQEHREGDTAPLDLRAVASALGFRGTGAVVQSHYVYT